jgi:hypothetical protein
VLLLGSYRYSVIPCPCCRAREPSRSSPGNHRPPEWCLGCPAGTEFSDGPRDRAAEFTVLIRDRDSKFPSNSMPCSPARASISCAPGTGTPSERFRRTLDRHPPARMHRPDPDPRPPPPRRGSECLHHALQHSSAPPRPGPTTTRRGRQRPRTTITAGATHPPARRLDQRISAGRLRERGFRHRHASTALRVAAMAFGH